MKCAQELDRTMSILTVSHQIAVKEAIPFEEFKQTRYAVLCTTSLGGHLSWFESGGTRWFAKPVRRTK